MFQAAETAQSGVAAGLTASRFRDRLSAGYLITLAARVVREVSELATRARETGKRLATLSIDTDAGTKKLELLEKTGRRLTFVAEMGPPTELREEDLDVRGQQVRAVVMRVGNPQCVVLGPATDERLQTLASALAVHPFFSAGTNVELAEVVSPKEVRILIWERGVGPTESSGTGTCAAAVAAAAYGGADRTVDVVSPGGRQLVQWNDAGIRLTGWAEVVGEVEWLTT